MKNSTNDSLFISVNRKEFIENVLYPISHISKDSNIKIDKDTITALVANEGVAFYSKLKTKTGLSSPLNLSIRDINKLIKLISCIQEEDIELEIKSNHLRYSSDSIRFKYHFLEDGIIKDPPINVLKIDDFEYDYKYIISLSKIKEILKMSSSIKIGMADNAVVKVYFKFTDSGVFAELTDKAMENSDSIDVLISDDFVGDKNNLGIPIILDLMKFLNYSKCSMFEVKYSSEKKVFVFSGERDKYICKYITSALKN